MKNKLINSFLIIIFLVGCSDQTANDDKETSNNGPYYAEFLACSAGPDFNRENMDKLIADWNELDLSEDLIWAGGYAPYGENHSYENGWWELNWTSKESAEAAWKEWMANDEAQAWDKNSDNVLDCDTSRIFSWDLYIPGPSPEDFGSMDYFVTATQECVFNENKDVDDLKANIKDFNAWLDGNSTGEPYMYGVYLSNSDTDSDFLWLNWHKSFDDMNSGNKNWAETGQSVQDGFDKTATCKSPDLYESREFRNISG